MKLLYFRIQRFSLLEHDNVCTSEKLTPLCPRIMRLYIEQCTVSSGDTNRTYTLERFHLGNVVLWQRR